MPSPCPFPCTWRTLTLLTAAAALTALAGCDDRKPSATPQPAPSATPAAAPRAAAPAEPPRNPRFGSADPIAKPTGALRIVSYNVENLFDDHDDPELSGRNEDREMTKPAAHMEALAATLRRIDGDVLALQEVESEQALLWFRDAYIADMGYAHVASIDAGDARGIEQSVLSRYPIVEVRNWPGLPLGGTHPEKWGSEPNFNAGQPITFHRSPLLVTVEVPAEQAAGDEPYRVTLLVVHQKSGREGDYWRRKEAAKTVEIAQELLAADPDLNIIIAGDFNARPDDAPMQTFWPAGFIDAFADRTPGDPAGVTHESGRTIDFIVLNSAAARELIAETRFILGTPARPAGVDWRTYPPPPGYASDHYPLVIDLSTQNR